MPLLAPEAKGPLSTCSKKVRVRGHIAGATVRVLVNGSETTSKLSNWPDDIFDIGTGLNAGDRVTARQEFNGETSPESPLPVIVQHVPPTLASLTIATRLYRCGTAIWTEGAVPGAGVKAWIGTTQVGAGSSIDGVARLTYEPGLNLNQTLSLVQTTCTNQSKTTVSQPADPLPNALPTPFIIKPLIECMTAITIYNVVDGATVTLYRNGTKEASTAFDRSLLTWVGIQPLHEGDKIRVGQSFTCRTPGKPPPDGEAEPTHTSSAGSATVQSTASLPTPIILKPICPDAQLITLTNLLPGARVILSQNGKDIGTTDTPDATYSFSAPQLDPTATLTARLQLCAKDGPLSEPVKITGDKPLEYLTVPTLYECAAHIFIRNDAHLDKGKIVYARNKQGDVISAYHQVYVARFLFPVSPALVAGDEITIVVLGCGGSEQKFGPHKVAPLPDRLPAPEVHEPTEGSTGVVVIAEFSGALITVYVNGVFRGQSILKGDSTLVPLSSPPLALGQQVTATQLLCDKLSPLSKPATVVIPRPQVPQLIQPSDGATGVAAKPATFEWADPGADTSAAATTFSLHVYEGGTEVYQDSGPSDQHATNLKFGTTYIWKVVAANSTGSTQSVTRSFATEAEPPPPPQQSAILVFGSSLYASYDGSTQVWPVPAGTPFHLCVVVGNVGNATSDPFEIVFAWQGNSQSGSTTVSAPAAAPNWSDVAHVTFQNGLAEGQYTLEVALMVNNTVVDYTYWNAWIGL